MLCGAYATTTTTAHSYAIARHSSKQAAPQKDTIHSQAYQRHTDMRHNATRTKHAHI
jgi:hypothetical protein